VIQYSLSDPEVDRECITAYPDTIPQDSLMSTIIGSHSCAGWRLKMTVNLDYCAA